jgi:hypothetical protein
MAVPYTFGSATTSIPLSQLDSNFATTITLGNTAIQLGNTVTTLNNMTLANVTISSGTSNVSSTSIANGTSNVTIASSGGAIAMATNGTTAVTIDTSQNVGIGTTSPTATGGYDKAIDLVGGSNGAGLYIRGATNPSTVYAAIQYDNGSNRTNINAIGTNNFMRFVTVDTERMRIDSSGSVQVGTTSALGSARVTIKTPDGSGSLIPLTLAVGLVSDGFGGISFRNPNGQQGSVSINSTSVSYNTTSDYRLKENAQPMTGALAKVAQLKPVTYQWKINGRDSEGFIAHELAEVCPQAVTGEKDATHEEEYEVTPAVKDQQGNITTPAVMGTRTVPSYQGIDTSFLVATLTAAIQELKAINDTQAETINALTARIVALESK